MSRRRITVGSSINLLIVVLALTGAPASASEDVPGTKSGSDPAIAFHNGLTELLPILLETYRIPGVSIGAIHDGKVVLAQGYGMTEIGGDVLMTSTTVFNIASISKTVAAMGAMKLVETGQIGLDDPISKYLTRWKLPTSSEFDIDEVTLRRILSHTAGLSVRTIGIYEMDEPLPTLEAALTGSRDGSGRVFVRYKPGEYHYSGGGYTLLQLIIEEISGKPFSEFMDTELFQPLSMSSSSFKWDDPIIAGAATPHEGGKPIPLTRYVAKAAGNLQTTVDDFLRFMLASFGRGSEVAVLKPETLELMQQPPHGLGLELITFQDRKIVAHSGGGRGWSANFAMFPESRSGVVVLVNGTGGKEIINAVMPHWLNSFHGTDLKATHEAPEFPIELEQRYLSRTIGSYQAPNGIIWEFQVANNRLKTFVDGSDKYLYPRSETEFFMYPLGDFSFKFVFGDNDKAMSVLVGPSADGSWTEMPRIGE